MGSNLLAQIGRFFGRQKPAPEQMPQSARIPVIAPPTFGENPPAPQPAPPMNIAPDALVREITNRQSAQVEPSAALSVPTIAAPNDIVPSPAPTAATTAPVVPYSAFESPRAGYEQQLAGLGAKDYSKAIYVNPETGDTSGKGGAGYVLEKAAGLERDKNWSTGDKVTSAIVGALRGLGRGGILGAAAGAVEAGTNRNYQEQYADEQNKNRLLGKIATQQKLDDFNTNEIVKQTQIGEVLRRPEKEAAAAQAKIDLEQNKVKARVESETQKFNNRMSVLDKQQKFAGNNWEKYTDENGKIWKKYKDGAKSLEPVINPATGEQDINPGEQFYETVSPITGQPVKIKGNQLFSGESSIAAGNAQREQQANKDNVSNLGDWQKIVDGNAQKRVALVNEGNAKINQSYELEKQATTAEQQAKDQSDTLEAQALELEMSATDASGKVVNKGAITKAATIRQAAANAKSQAAQHRIQAAKLREEGNGALNNAQNLKDPPRPSEVKAQKVGGKYAGQYFPSPKTLKSAFPNKSEAEIRQIIEANGGKFQD